MIVHRVLTGSAESWTLLGEDGLPAEPAEAYLAYLTALERSPNTLRAYAHSLRMWLEFLSGQRTGWREAGVEQVARFAAWLRAPAANVIVLDAGESARTAATVNRHLAAVFGFYDFHARAGVGLAADLVAWHAGVIACFGCGLVEFMGAFVAQKLRMLVPRLLGHAG